MNIPQTITFAGMDSDSSNQNIQPGSVRAIYNMRPSDAKQASVGSLVNVKGNVNIPYDLPTGNNTCIGCFGDERGNSLIWFNANSEGQHAIYRYFLDSGAIHLIRQSELLNFSPDHQVNGVDLVENLLYWTDDYNPPRSLDIERADQTNKEKVFNINFPDILPAGDYLITASYPDNPIDFTLLINIGTEMSRIDAAIAFTDQIDSALQTVMVATNIGLFVSVTITAPTLVLKSLTLSGGESEAWIASQNFFMGDSEMYFDAVKRPFWCEPKTNMLRDASRTENYLKGTMFQFGARPVYFNNEKAAWSPYSIIPLDPRPANRDVLKTNKNYITLDYSDEGRLYTDEYRTMVKRVELMMRIADTGTWRLITALESYELTGTFKFYNDGIYADIDPAEVTKPYDNLPIIAGSETFFKGRLFYTNNLFGYDQINTSMAFVPQYPGEPSQAYCDITFDFVIQNENIAQSSGRFNPVLGLNQIVKTIGDHDPFYGAIGISLNDNDAEARAYRMGQSLKLGFVSYIAGTDFVAFSEQEFGLTPFDVNKIYFQRFTFKNVPAGKTVVIRIASNLLRDDDNNGRLYNIQADNLGYQRTSTYLVKMPGQAIGSTEIVLTLPSTGGAINLTPSATDFTGWGILADLSFHSSGTAGAAVCGYAVQDPSGDNTYENMIGSISMEGQRILMVRNTVTQNNLPPTDHNGFFWTTSVAGTAGPGPTYAFKVLGKQVGATTIELKTLNAQFWAATLGGSGTHALAQSGPPPFVQPLDETIQVILYADEADNANGLRTAIKGTVIDTLNQPVSDISVVYTRCGKQTFTDEDGTFQIQAFDMAIDTASGRTADVLIIDSQVIVYPLSILPFRLDNPGGASNYFDSQFPFFANPNNSGSTEGLPFVVTDLALQKAYFKRGGNYRAGIVYFDYANRSTACISDARYGVRIPFFTQPTPAGIQGGPAELAWEINHEAPEWATHYALVIEIDRAYNSYLQIVAAGAKYITALGSSAADSTQAFYGINATQVIVNISTISTYAKDHASSQLGYTYTQGDRMKLIKDADGNLYSTYYDTEITGQFDGFNLIIDSIGAWPEIKQGVEIEIYTPKRQALSSLFYAMGSTYDIYIDSEGRHLHKGPIQDQHIDNISGNNPALGVFDVGDTYYRTRSMRSFDPFNNSIEAVSVRMVEAQGASDFYPSTAVSIGRPYAVNPDDRQIRKTNNIVFTNIFLNDTLINGLSEVEAANSKDTPFQYGAITRIIPSGPIICLVHENETADMYVEETILNDVTGAALIAQADKVISTIRILVGGFGTKHPGTVVSYNNVTYFYDGTKKKVVRRGQNGLEPISSVFGFDSYFQNHPTINNPIAIVDNSFTESGELLMKLNDVAVAFDEKTNRWETIYEYTPEMYGRVESTLFSFKNGELWEHGANEAYNTFYGAAVVSRIEMVGNMEPDKVKIWAAIALRTNNDNWTAPVVTNPEGQMTDLIPSMFKNKENSLYASFYRDTNTPNMKSFFDAFINGNFMRSNVLLVTITNDSTERVTLDWVQLRGDLSRVGWYR